jgi:Tfp pilus assembly protein PilO
MKLTKLLKWRLLSICFSILFIIIISEAILPAYSNWIEQSKSIILKNEQVELSENWQQELVKLNNEKNRLDSKYKRISQDYHVLHNLSDAIELLNDVAGQNSITILDLHTGDKTRIEDFEQLEITTDIEGSFNNIGKFLKELEKPKNPLQLAYLTIERTETALHCSLKLTITILKEQQ